jgi:hypothetical protein
MARSAWRDAGRYFIEDGFEKLRLVVGPGGLAMSASSDWAPHLAWLYNIRDILSQFDGGVSLSAR